MRTALAFCSRESALRETTNFTTTLQRPWTLRACIHKLRLSPNRAKAAVSHLRPQTTLNVVYARGALHSIHVIHRDNQTHLSSVSTYCHTEVNPVRQLIVPSEHPNFVSKQCARFRCGFTRAAAITPNTRNSSATEGGRANAERCRRKSSKMRHMTTSYASTARGR